MEATVKLHFSRGLWRCPAASLAPPSLHTSPILLQPPSTSHLCLPACFFLFLNAPLFPHHSICSLSARSLLYSLDLLLIPPSLHPSSLRRPPSVPVCQWSASIAGHCRITANLCKSVPYSLCIKVTIIIKKKASSVRGQNKSAVGDALERWKTPEQIHILLLSLRLHKCGIFPNQYFYAPPHIVRERIRIMALTYAAVKALTFCWCGKNVPAHKGWSTYVFDAS